MKRILFVDDDPNVLEGLERMLFPLRKEWHMAFAPSGQAALDIMSKEPFDLIVSDMRMPGMDGAALLTEVMNRYPDTVRFVFSGQPDKETLLRSVGPAHQYIAKPCDAKTLKASVDRALALRDSIQSEAVKKIASQLGSLPPLPDLFAKLMDELRAPDPSIAAIGEIIQADVAMTAKILQLVNSAFFGLRQNVSSATQAVALLGLDMVKSLVLMGGVFAQIDERKLPAGFSLDTLWRHSMKVGVYARTICKLEPAPKETVNDAFTAGLLHDTGILILATGCSQAYEKLIKSANDHQIDAHRAEQTAFGCSHAELGAYLLGIWGLPNSIVEAVAFHHCPGLCPAEGFTPLTAVHVANALAREIPAPDAAQELHCLDMAYLTALGLDTRVRTWQEACSALQTEKEAKS